MLRRRFRTEEKIGVLRLVDIEKHEGDFPVPGCVLSVFKMNDKNERLDEVSNMQTLPS